MKKNTPNCYVHGRGHYPGTKLRGANRYAKLYHYTSFDTFVKIWLSKKLRFGVQKNLNDLNEANKYVSTVILKDSKTRIRKGLDAISDYKQISLTKDYDSYTKGSMSPMMWGHYGDKSNGVCIELDYKKLILEKDMFHREVKYIKYLKEPIDIPSCFNSEIEFQKHIFKNKIDIFFTKLDDWKGENEYRIISKNHDFLDIENAISAIYVRNVLSDSCKMAEKLIDNKIPVYLFHYMDSGEFRVPTYCDAKQKREDLIALNKTLSLYIP